MGETALILSSGRTGTQFLAHYLDANFDGVVARHEPSPSRLFRIASHAQLLGLLSKPQLGALLRATRGRRRGAPGLYVESNPFLTGFIEVLGEAFDDPLVIHVVRDPRDHARSSLNHGTGSGWKGLANRFAPLWYPNVRRILELPSRPSWLGQAAGVWTIFNRMLCEAGPRYRRYHLLKYEELFDPSGDGLRRLCGWLGLPHRDAGLTIEADTRINASRRSVAPPWREWPVAWCRELHAICGPLAEQLGYGDEPEWRMRLGGGA